MVVTKQAINPLGTRDEQMAPARALFNIKREDEDFKSYDEINKLYENNGRLIGNYLIGGESEEVATLILNLDLKSRRQEEEINNFITYLNGGVLMEDKDVKLMMNDIEKMLNKNFDNISTSVSDKLKPLETKLAALEISTAQTCKDGSCLTKSISEIKDEIGIMKNSLKENVSELNTKNTTIDETLLEIKNNIDKIGSISEIKDKVDKIGSISEIKDKIDKVCKGIDCINQRNSDEDNTAVCPSCGGTFIWNETIIKCPHCGVTFDYS